MEPNTTPIGEKRFAVAFSFPGEHRKLVTQIANGIARVFSKERVLYDFFHRAEFARPNLDVYLQSLYKDESELVVVFICSEYNEKKWCGVEWKAIRALMNSKEADDRILFIKCGDGEVAGVFGAVDGYIDAAQISVKDIINDILTRHSMVSAQGKSNDRSEESTEFVFALNPSGEVVEIPISTRNNIRKWHFDDKKDKVTVKILDKRQAEIAKNRSHIDQKINMQKELSPLEEVQYEQYTRAIKKCEHECKIKEQAIKFFLEDKMLQAYIHITTYLELVDYLKEILNYEYYDQEKYNGRNNIILDVFLDPSPKTCHGYFVVCVESSQIEEALGGVSMRDFWGAYVIDLGIRALREISICFYLSLAEEVIDFNRVEISDNKRVMNLLEYRVGLH